MRRKDSAWGRLGGFLRETGQGAPIRLVGHVHLRSRTAVCWHCGRPTTVHALVACEVVDMSGPCRAPCYVRSIHHPPQALLDAIPAWAPQLRLAASRTGAQLLANHCEHCDALQTDYMLYEGKDPPFRGEPPPGDFGAVLFEDGLDLEYAEFVY